MTYAGFWRRFAALIIDILIVLVPASILAWILPYVGGFALTLVYFPVFESSWAQTTPGKYVMGMKVVTEKGDPLTFWQALARHLMKYPSAFLCFLGYFMQVFTVKRQTLHDMIVGAVVVRHDFKESPDWVQAWLGQMRYIFKVDEKPASAPTSPSVGSANSAVSAAVFPTPAKLAEITESIEKLHELYKQGALSEEEFQSKKASFLKQI